MVSDHWLTGPARRTVVRDPAARLVAERECQRCHAEVTHEWSRSQHAGSWSDPAFQRAFAAEPRAFCQRCHAPEEDPAAAPGEVSQEAAALGVGCVTCHVAPGSDEVWAASRTNADGTADGSADGSADGTTDGSAPHPIVRGLGFAGPQVCAACHEFGFPDNALRDRPLAMQSTLTEHRRSAASGRSCAECHMPQQGRRRSHAFAGAYDRSMLAQSLEIEARRPSPTKVAIQLAPGRVGHAVPTGDLLRRLMVEVVIDDPNGPHRAPAFVSRRYFGRRFGPVRQAHGITLRGELADERVGGGDGDGVRLARFTVPSRLREQPVRWRVVHQRVAQSSLDPRKAPVDGELTVTDGVLRPSMGSADVNSRNGLPAP
ncbi:MAG: multiheme c-type cytochrome [Myxococcota bacterium]